MRLSRRLLHKAGIPFRILKPILPTSLWWRSVIIMTAPLILIQIIALWAFYDRHWEVVTKRLSAALASEIHIIALLAERSETPSEMAAISSLAAHTMRFKVNYTQGLFETAATPDWRFSPPTDLRAKLSEALIRTGKEFRIDEESVDGEVLVYVQLDDGYLEILVHRKRLFSDTLYIFLFWTVGAGVVLLIVAGLFWRNQVRPIRRLAEAADAFGRGDRHHLELEGAYEVRSAATAFIDMRSRMKKQVDQRTRMLAGVSHDLRTPLTRMKLELAMSTDQALARAVENDVLDMEAMIEGYLAFARGEEDEALELLDLKTLVSDLCQNLHVQAKANKSKITFVRSEALVEIKIRPNAIRRCLSNLIVNSLRFATKVEITINQTTQYLCVCVDDDGPGIPENKRKDVLQPFFRLDESRNEATGGVGLGLSIAQDIALAHGGRLDLKTSKLGGLSAQLILPL